jgi:uncharacterized protein (TIGR00251 family)
MLKCIRPCKDGVLIDIHVIPNSKREGVEYDETGGRLRVRVLEPPVKDKANKAILRKFSSVFGNCEIISGKSSKKKTVLIKETCIEEIEKILK